MTEGRIRDYEPQSKRQSLRLGRRDVKFPGLALVVQEISYDDEQEMEESYGKGSKPRGYGKGNYKARGKCPCSGTTTRSS